MLTDLAQNATMNTSVRYSRGDSLRVTLVDWQDLAADRRGAVAVDAGDTAAEAWPHGLTAPAACRR